MQDFSGDSTYSRTDAVRRFLLLTVALTGLLSLTTCSSEPVPAPRPRAYPKVVYPEKQYQPLETGYCPFTFSYPSYTRIEQQKLFFDERPVHDCWFDIYYPQFDARIHFSYYPVGRAGKDLNQLWQDAFELADWHNKRANYIDELRINRPEAKVSGIAFEMKGASASPYQFFVTDSTNHFVRAALYFNTQARPDSLAPVVQFVKEDIVHLLETFQWQQ
jgi:gliding motility-associated lipoprotein GldD